MLRRVLVSLLLAVVVVGCSPSVSVPGVTVHIPAVVPAAAPVRPGVHVFYSDLDRFELAEALGHAAEVVHPRYEVSNAALGVGRIRYAGDELAETYMRDLSNGRTALLVYPEDLAAEPRLQPVIEAFEAARGMPPRRRGTSHGYDDRHVDGRVRPAHRPVRQAAITLYSHATQPPSAKPVRPPYSRPSSEPVHVTE